MAAPANRVWTTMKMACVPFLKYPMWSSKTNNSLKKAHRFARIVLLILFTKGRLPRLTACFLTNFSSCISRTFRLRRAILILRLVFVAARIAGLKSMLIWYMNQSTIPMMMATRHNANTTA
jgi:hypothetical protein